MRPYLLSFGAGLLVGVIYGLLRVRSPAPPMIALLGLLGILLGEQLPALLRGARARAHAHHVLGALPSHHDLVGGAPPEPRP